MKNPRIEAMTDLFVACSSEFLKLPWKPLEDRSDISSIVDRAHSSGQTGYETCWVLAYVMLDGRRVPVEPECMKNFSLVLGQAINYTIFEGLTGEVQDGREAADPPSDREGMCASALARRTVSRRQGNEIVPSHP